MRVLRSVAVCGLVLGGVACDAHDPASSEAADASTATESTLASASAHPTARGSIPVVASVAMPTPRPDVRPFRGFLDAKPEHPTLAAARALLAHEPRIANLVDDAPKGLGLAKEGFVSEAWAKPHPTDWSHIGAVLPHRADDVLRVSPVRIDRWAMSLAPQGFAPVVGQLDRGRVVYPGVRPFADLIAVAGERQIEEFVLLKDAKAPTEYRWKVQIGSGLHERVTPRPDGVLDFLDAKGDAALRIYPPFVIDASGVQRDAEMRLEGEELVIRADVEKLAFPVLLDPVIEVPIWQLRASSGYAPGLDTTLTFSSNTGQSILLGGAPQWSASGTSYLTTGYAWNGTSWATYSTSASFAPRWKAAATVDDYAVMIFGGENASGLLGDTWVTYAGQWWNPSSAGGPPAAAAAPIANIVGQGQFVYGTDSNTYLFNKSWTWSQYVNGAGENSQRRPTPRTQAVMVGDDSQKKALMFGGLPIGGSTPISDGWIFNPAATPNNYNAPYWMPICGPGWYTGCPLNARYGAGAAYDANRRKIVIHGGNNQFWPICDTWEYDVAAGTWTQLSPGTYPSTCWGNGIGMTYDSARRRIVEAGGYQTSSAAFYTNTNELYVRGGSCAADADCDTGHCVEGTCCESVCGTCQTCVDPSSPGACKDVAAGTSDPLSRCPSGGQCNGSGACLPPSGSSCTSGAQCATGYCVNGTCCTTSSCGVGLTCADPSGTCRKVLGQTCVQSSDCASGNCVDGVCCSSASCGASMHCNYTSNPGTCLADNGQACTGNGQCGSGNCVDGYCCSTACGGQCQACDVAGALGTCVPITGAPHGARASCGGSGPCAASCNGVDANACKFPGSTIACGAASCSAGMATSVGQCDGAGNCSQATASCGAYVCDATSCKTTCASDGDCAAGSFCKSGSCVGIEMLGEACTGDAQCLSGHCTDHVCCAVASCGAGAACASSLGATPGQCLKSNASTCASGPDCASGHCVDGVCCDKPCDGQCEACDVTGSAGTCTPVTGAPHGSRAACDALAADDCAKAACDGATRDKCAGFVNGTATPCGADACTSDKKLQKHGTCDGRGACARTDPLPCDPYACNPGSNACHTSCGSDADCADGFTCDASKSQCVPGASCSADKTQSIDKTGVATSCAPYLCGTDGTCLKACATSDDCVSGTSCDETTHACIGITNTTASSGGCDASGAGGGSNAAFGIGAIVGLAAIAARRRR